MSLLRDMFWASTVLEAANQRCGMPQRTAWTATDLRRESRILAAEEAAEAESTLEKIRMLLLNGRLIGAIKYCRENTQMSLREAKEFVESFPEYQGWRLERLGSRK